MDIIALIGVLALVYVSFTISASAGLGGSLVLVPTLVLFIGPKEGVALAALLLASNNVMRSSPTDARSRSGLRRGSWR
jgi:uncharacterized membrane protein YfcA